MAKKDEEPGIGHNGAPMDGTVKEQLRSFIERIERLEEEKKQTSDDIKDIYSEAKANGFDTKVMRKIVALRKRDKDEVLEQNAIMEIYCEALGLDFML